jgi:integrase
MFGCPRNRVNFNFLFSTTWGRSPVSGWTRAKERLDRLSGVTDWRIHDLRRTVASGLARDGVPPQVISAVLNHSPKSIMGVTAIYNRHRYDAEKRDALSRWAESVGRLVLDKAALANP